MEKQEFFSSILNEKYYFAKYEKGPSLYLFPKKDYNSCYAIFGTNYGSINESFKVDNKIQNTPAGVAHYLEHKLFESEECDAFELFSKTGASANAYTSYDKTAYLFSCNDNFYESLRILLEFVQNPYFTDENVEKEREIINQEIKMYRDNPESRVSSNLLSNMYKFHPVKTDIAGTVESIAKITPKILYDCYYAFYNPNHMALCIVGNFDMDSTVKIIEGAFGSNSDETNDSISKSLKYKNGIEFFPENEPEEVIKKYICEKMDISMPIFSFGFKEKINTKFLTVKEAIITSIILSSLSQKSSLMYNEILDKKLINNNFSSEHFSGPYFSSLIFSGESKDPKQVSDIIMKHTQNLIKNGLENGLFERTKLCMYAQSVSSFNKISNIANILLDFNFSGYEIFNYVDLIGEITLEEVNESLKNKFNCEYTTLSVIEPSGNNFC